MLKGKSYLTAVCKLKPPVPEAWKLSKCSFRSSLWPTTRSAMNQKLSNSVDVRNVEADTTRCYKSSVAKLLHACGDAADVYTFSVTALCREPSEVTSGGGLIRWCDWRLSRRKRQRKLNKAASFLAAELYGHGDLLVTSEPGSRGVTLEAASVL